MDILTLFFVFLAVALVGIVGAVINMGMAVSSRDPLNSMRGTMFRHLFFGLFWVIGGLGGIVTGLIWVVQQFS